MALGKFKKPGLVWSLTIIMALLLVTANLVLGITLVNSSKKAIKTLIQNRMLDISNTAAAMLDGDVLRSLTAEDADTDEYKKVNDTLAVFQENIDLRYIYCINDNGDGTFSFSVDPTIEDPGVFGEPVAYTDALKKASEGTPSVDDKPYKDAWGHFYSAYSPVFASDGKVAGVVAVDFDADWYEAQISKQTRAIVIAIILSVMLGAVMVFIGTSRLRKALHSITDDLTVLSKDIDTLNLEVNPDYTPEEAKDESADSVQSIGRKVHDVRDSISRYKDNIHSQANSMITALSSDYRGVYYINLDTGEGVCYQEHTHIVRGLHEGDHFPFHDIMAQYAETCVADDYREEFLKFTSPETVRENLANDRIITYRYMINLDGVESYEMLRIAGVRHPEDRDDHIVHAIGLGFTDVDEETKRTLAQSRALTDALTAAEAANKAKTVFLSSMSHEIRTPMNAIIGLDKIALNDKTISDSTRDHLEKIGASADHLLSIINDILDMSRIEAGRMAIRKEVFSLKTLLSQTDAIISSQCKEKNLTWKNELKGECDEYYIGDDMKLRQVLINILGNAVKFTPEGGTVSLTTERIAHYDDLSTFRFTISDTGIGMSEEFLPTIFEAFSQEDFSARSEYGSTGLGMPITKNIVDLMNGEIEVTSKKGEGTTFTVTITLNDTDKESMPEEEQIPGKIDEISTAETGEVKLEGRMILIAEDMDVNADILRMVLGMRDIKSERAENGKVAVEMFASRPDGYYDAILMDMRMPEMNGLEATKAIREMERIDSKTIPIIALTANAFDEDVELSVRAGLNAHLSKPVEPVNLFETLETFIKA